MNYRHFTEVCPAGFEEIRGFCFVKGTEEKTFDNATLSCQQLGGFLAEPRSAEASDAVKIFTFQSNYLWIGLHDQDMEGNFRWQTDGAELSYTNWEVNQPNDYGAGQDCVGLYKTANKWEDAECFLTYEYLCQAEKSKSLF